MSKTVRILGIAGSLRNESYNRAALRAATELVPEGATIEIFELDGLPGFNQDDEQNPPAKVTELKRLSPHSSMDVKRVLPLPVPVVR